MQVLLWAPMEVLWGGWIKGLVYGANFSGSKYGAYVHGKTITNDVIAVLNTNQGTQERTATYATTSMKVEVTDKGKNNLTQGRTVVIFGRQFSSLLSPNEEVIITVMPLAYIKQSKKCLRNTYKNKDFLLFQY